MCKRELSGTRQGRTIPGTPPKHRTHSASGDPPEEARWRDRTLLTPSGGGYRNFIHGVYPKILAESMKSWTAQVAVIPVSGFFPGPYTHDVSFMGRPPTVLIPFL